MYHFSTGIRLLPVIGNCYRIKFADGIISLQNTGRIFPGNRRTGFNLRPRNFGICPATGRAFGYKVVYSAFAVLIPGIPVLHGGIFDFGIFHYHNFNNCGMQLVFVPLGRRTAFEIRNIAFVIGYDEGSLKLSGVFGINAEIG